MEEGRRCLESEESQGGGDEEREEEVGTAGRRRGKGWVEVLFNGRRRRLPGKDALHVKAWKAARAN